MYAYIKIKSNCDMNVNTYKHVIFTTKTFATCVFPKCLKQILLIRNREAIPQPVAFYVWENLFSKHKIFIVHLIHILSLTDDNLSKLQVFLWLYIRVG